MNKCVYKITVLKVGSEIRSLAGKASLHGQTVCVAPVKSLVVLDVGTFSSFLKQVILVMLVSPLLVEATWGLKQEEVAARLKFTYELNNV